MHPISPITGDNKTKLERFIPTKTFISMYERDFKIDVSRFFKGIKRVGLYECLESGYRFYYPFTLGGDSRFYELLQTFPWYYMNWKWEHEMTLKFVGRGMRVIEVGCGPGTFIKKIAPLCFDACGLEINDKFIDARSKIFGESLQKHAKFNPEKYDIVCAFEVLEHVADVENFIKDSLKLLKKGGKLVVSVPNNHSLILSEFGDMALNMPPHHMGLWEIKSLINLQNFFSMKIISLEIEPLQNYHLGFAKNLWKRDFQNYLYGRAHNLRSIIKLVNEPFVDATIRVLAPYLVGHTLFAVYEKIGKLPVK